MSSRSLGLDSDPPRLPRICGADCGQVIFERRSQDRFRYGIHANPPSHGASAAGMLDNIGILLDDKHEYSRE
jgi:hypothetical protein